MFDKVMASMRIGGAEVDTLLDQDTVRPGESLPVQVVVEGGEADQKIEEIELELKTKRERNDHRETYEISSRRVSGPFTIYEDERQVFEAELPIHRETPVTAVNARRNQTEVWIDTDLEIDNAIDGDDTDYLRVAPTDPMQKMLDAVDRAGHHLSSVTVDDDRIKTQNAQAELPLDQEFKFRPDGRRDYKELEIHFIPRSDVTHVLVEFDYRRRSEQFESIEIDHDDYSVDSLKRDFENLQRS